MFQPKIFNDPVYGFITIADPLIQQLVDHPYFQRLARISQVGLSDMVYPGAQHTRFHHALGAMHLMQQAIEVLRMKKVEITDAECQAAQIAILLHDIGHGPFSHTLENTILEGYTHEEISLKIMERLNFELGNQLSMAIAIFKNEYSKTFFHQLVSGQLDTDRLDYLMRDSFYTGVAEGIIGSERIIKMMNVVDDKLVVEEKGIYSIEKFLIARRLMYWQVYLHKTVLGAEMILMQVLRRAKELAKENVELFATSPLKRFLYAHLYPFASDREKIEQFVLLDDYDIVSGLKEWTRHPDPVLSDLCNRLMNRKLFRVRLSSVKVPDEKIFELTQRAKNIFSLTDEMADYYVQTGEVTNLAYDASKGDILFRMKDGRIINLFEASDHLSADMSKEVKKYFICYPKELS